MSKGYYFVSYSHKYNTSENFQHKQAVLDYHPFLWLQEKFRFLNIEVYVIINFLNISLEEFEMFPGDKILQKQ